MWGFLIILLAKLFTLFKLVCLIKILLSIIIVCNDFENFLNKASYIIFLFQKDQSYFASSEIRSFA